MFWGFGYFNNPFMLNTFFMPNFFCNFGFNVFPNLFMPAPFVFASPVYGPSIFQFRQNNVYTEAPPRPTRKKRHIDITTGNSPARRVKTVVTEPAGGTGPASQKVIKTDPAKSVVTTSQNNTRNVSSDNESAFLKRTKQIARKINCDYKDLLALMNSESKINSKAVNSSSGATGLIQFTPQTAKDLGTTTAELKNMSPVEQLDYVEKYLVKYKKAAGFKANEKLDAGDLYALVFLPGRANRDILTDESEKYYAANAPALDLNNDGKITKDELSRRMMTHRVSDSIFLA